MCSVIVSFPAHLNEDLLDGKTVVSAPDPAFQNLKKIYCCIELITTNAVTLILVGSLLLQCGT